MKVRYDKLWKKKQDWIYTRLNYAESKIGLKMNADM